MDLIAQSAEKGNAFLPVRWCLSQEEADQLEEREAMNPYLLLVVEKPEGGVFSASSNNERHLFPLEDLMAYIPFQRAWKYTLRATVVWYADEVTQSEAESVLEDDLLRKEGGDYYTSVWSDRQDAFYESFGGVFVSRLSASATTEVEVDEAFFASEPPEWEQAWVTRIWDTPVKDQCDYRRRRIFAYTVQPVLMLLYAAGWGLSAVAQYLFALIMVLFGLRNLDFSPLWPPLSSPLGGKDNFRDIIEDAGPPIWFTRETEDEYGRTDYEVRPAFFFAVNPITAALVVAFAVFGVDLIFGLLVVGGLGVLLQVVDWGTNVFGNVADWLEKKHIEARKRETRQMKEAIACREGLEADFDELPRRARTAKLWFQHVKAKVCKPFQQ